MKTFLHRIIHFSLLLIICFSCKQSKTDNTVAYINNVPITYNEIDNTIKQELFDALNNIYLTRKIALDDYIKEQLLQIEAKKRGISTDSLLNSLYSNKIDEISLKNYAKTNNLEKGISIFERVIKTYAYDSEEGQKILLEKFKHFIVDNYIDSLKSVYKIKILLKAPEKPNIKIDDSMVHFKGNLKSKVTFLVITDYECDMCREYKFAFDTIFERYKSDIRFGFVNYSSYVTPSALASECANNQEKFWIFNDLAFSSKKILDTTDIFKIAQSMNLNIKKFRKDYFDESTAKKLDENIMKLRALGIYGTPTVIINDQIIFNSSSMKDIIGALEEEIRKHK